RRRLVIAGHRRRGRGPDSDDRADRLLVLVVGAQRDPGAIAQDQGGDEGEDDHDRQVHGHRGGRAGRRDQPLRDGRGEGAAEDRADGVGDRDPGEADAGGEELGVHRRLLAVGEAEADGEDDQSQQKQSQAAGVDQREQGEDADEQEDPAEQIGVLAPDPVRDGAGEDREDQPGDRRGGHGPQHGAALEADGSGRVRGVVLDVAAGGHVSGGIVAHEYQRGEDDEQPVAAQQLAQRVRHLLLALGDLMEDRRLLDAAADPVADEDEHDGQEEGHPPPPFEEGLARSDRGHQRQDSRGQEEADRDADLREGSAQPAGPLVGVLDREQDRPAPFAAGRDPLDRKSTRLNSSHVSISYAVFCSKKKTRTPTRSTTARRTAHPRPLTSPPPAPAPTVLHALSLTRRSSDLAPGLPRTGGGRSRRRSAGRIRAARGTSRRRARPRAGPPRPIRRRPRPPRSEEHTSELQSRFDLVCRLLLEKKNQNTDPQYDRSPHRASPPSHVSPPRPGPHRPPRSLPNTTLFRSSARTPEDRRRPIETPICGKDPRSPRDLSSACSTASRTAPPHSPPAETPWMMRRTMSRIGAMAPADS